MCFAIEWLTFALYVCLSRDIRPLCLMADYLSLDLPFSLEDARELYLNDTRSSAPIQFTVSERIIFAEIENSSSTERRSASNTVRRHPAAVFRSNIQFPFSWVHSLHSLLCLLDISSPSREICIFQAQKQTPLFKYFSFFLFFFFFFMLVFESIFFVWKKKKS